MSKLFFTFSFFIFIGNISAQVLPPVNCEDAYSICDSIITQDTIKVAIDTNPDEISNNSCLGFGEIRGTWYKFGVNDIGNLRFTITPFDTLTDFDWALFRVDWGNCTDIYGNAAYEIACNSNGVGGGNYTTGATGLLQQGHEPAVNVTTPALFYLYVTTSMSDTDAVLGYTIDFTASDFDLVGCGEIGIEEVSQVQHKVYPNPVSDKFYIQTENFFPMLYLLTDISGKTVRNFFMKDLTEGISVEGLSSGMYYYTIHGNGGKIISGKISVK
jgi:hypothetical protein